MNRLSGILEDVHHLDARAFIIAARRLADSLLFGTDRSAVLGSGIEYVQSRPYQPGDPVRAMDWRVTGRTGKYFVKEYEAPKCLPSYLVIDTSASMTVSSLARSKYETALFIAGGLAFACLDRVSPVGILSAGERNLRGSPTLSKNLIMRSLLDLRRYYFDEPTFLSKRLSELVPSLPQRSLFIVLSDLHDPGALAMLKRLGHLHDAVVLQMLDPAEILQRGAGIFRAREAETGRAYVTHGRAAMTDPAIVKNALRQAGIDHLVIRTDRPYEQALRHLFKSRGGVGRGTR